MKKLLLAIGLCFVATTAYAGYDYSTKNLSEQTPVTASTLTSSCYVPVMNMVTGDAEMVTCTDVYGIGATKAGVFTTLNSKQAQVAASTTPLTSAQCGSSVVSAGAAVQPLPEASTVLGCRYTFVCGTADDFDIDPADASDVIGIIGSITGTNTTTVITPSAGDEARCTDIGASVTLEAVGANLWAAVGASNGIWTDVN